MPDDELTKIEAALNSAISSEDVNQLGLQTRQSERMRIITPHRLFLAIVVALAATRVESLADLLREFNHQNRTATAYKAFYNRLARASFPAFMREMLCRLLRCLALKTLQADETGLLSRFDDIIIHDGSSFALKDVLCDVFPGRFTTVDPAAVELHATFSGFADNIASVALAPDCEAERHFLPEPEELQNKLLLADRGYPSVPYFEAVVKHGGSFIIRLTRSYDPWVRAVYSQAKPHSRSPRKPIRLSQFLAQNQGASLDLDVEFQRDKCGRCYRLLVLPGKERWMTRLCTNLDRAQFSVPTVGKLYRFRWQVELCFKEWKSYANLHAFDTGNEHIAAGLIWASVCAAVLKRFLAHAAQVVSHGLPMSTRRVAMCARHVIDAIAAELLRDAKGLAAVLRDGIDYLIKNARRAHPERDRQRGRQQAGLAVVGAAVWGAAK